MKAKKKEKSPWDLLIYMKNYTEQQLNNNSFNITSTLFFYLNSD